MSFIFGGNTGVSYEDIQKKRAIVEQLRSANASTPRNVGEGLHAIARGLVARAIEKQTSRQDQENRAALNAKWGALRSKWGALFGGGGTSASPGYSSAPPVPYDPNSPQAIGADAMTAIGKPTNYTPGDRESFTAAMMPYALQVSAMTGLDPRLVIAQAAQETGWGKSAPNNNFFGIKSHGKPGGATLSTTEYMGGGPVGVQDSFRTYSGMGESAMDYARFLQENPRYREMLAAQGLDAQIDALGRSGYATDPNYANSVRAIALSIGAQPGQSGGAPVIPAQMDVATLAEIAGSPYADAGMRAIAEALLGQQLRAMDPMRQMELERARLELEAMRNPQPEPVSPTDDMREYEFARSQGYPGTFQEFMADMKRAGASTVTVNNGPNGIDYGDPGEGLVWQRDAQGNIVMDERGAPVAIPFQGGKAWRDEKAIAAEAEAAINAANNRATAAATSGNVVIEDIGRLKKLVQDAPWYSPATGMGAGVLANIGGTNAANAAQLAETIKANIGFDRLQRMRMESPTGGALGQVAVQELQSLQATLGSLSQSQSEDQLIENLERLSEIYKGILDKVYATGDPAALGLPPREDQTNAGGTTLTYNPETGELE